MAQRLVRVLCSYCKERTEPDENMKKQLRVAEGEELHICKPKGCNECNFTGFRGRLGIFEIFAMNDELRELTLRKAGASELRAVARKNGMRLMLEDGYRKVKQGITTLEEVYSVTGGKNA